MKTTKIKISKEQTLKMNKAASRQIQIESGFGFSSHRVHKSVKDYNRREYKKIDWD